MPANIVYDINGNPVRLKGRPRNDQSEMSGLPSGRLRKDRPEGEIYLKGQDLDDSDTKVSIHQYTKLRGINYTRTRTAIIKAKTQDCGVSNHGAVQYRVGDIDAAIEEYTNKYNHLPEALESRLPMGMVGGDLLTMNAGIDSLDRKRLLECERIQINLDVMRRNFISVEEVKAQLIGLIKMIQQRLIVINPRALPPRLVNQSPRDIQAILAEDGKEFLNELYRIAPDIIGNDTRGDNSIGNEFSGVGG